ncbi:hypothetical protein Scep_012392 [Stephania cephalantha]|uniref:DUF8040 domain-containing protein n=1 Tax=Stephania cephalantha TaxID=152367 RepID=A0AAP0P7G4_9MAGN
MLRMRRKPFEKLRDMLYEHGKLRDKRCVLVDEQLAITLHILGHNIRNRVISTWFQRSEESVSKVFGENNSRAHTIATYAFEAPRPNWSRRK